MILLDDLCRTSQPVVRPLRGNVGEIVAERSMGFVHQPVVGRPIKCGILWIVDIRTDRTSDSEEEVMLDAVRRGPEMQSLSAYGLGEISHQVDAAHLDRGPIREPVVVHGKAIVVLKHRYDIFGA